MTLFERLSELAKKQGKSLNKVAEENGLSKNALYQWKTSSPKADTLQKVADYFHVSTDYLLGRTDNRNVLEIEKDSGSPEYFTIQRKSKQLTQKDQQRLLKIMEATFDDLDNGSFEEDDDDDL